MKIGDLRILPVSDGVGVEVAAEILGRPGVTDAWACHPDEVRSDGTLELPLGGFCIATGDQVVLVDAGWVRTTTGSMSAADCWTVCVIAG